MAPLRLATFGTLALILALAAPAGAQLPIDWADEYDAQFLVTADDTGQVFALLALDPEAPVLEVTLWDDGCDFGPAVEEEPGFWVAEAAPGTLFLCSAEVHVSLGTPGDGGGNGGAECPFVGLDGAVLTGGAYTDSADGGHEGHVCSNGAIRLSGSATIYGDARHGAKGLRASGNAGATGTVEQLAEPIVPEDVPLGTAGFVNDNAGIPLTSRGRTALGDDGELKLSSHDHLELPPGVYYFTELKLSGHSSIGISGPTEIFVGGDADLSGGSVLNTNRDPADLTLYVMGRRVKLTGQSDLYAQIHAPTARVERTGGSHFYGTIMAGALRATGNGGLHAVAASGGGDPVETGSFTLFWENSEF